jgi:hypothetical protein
MWHCFNRLPHLDRATLHAVAPQLADREVTHSVLAQVLEQMGLHSVLKTIGMDAS